MNTSIIEGNPTKKFFIEMITRDISIEDAIIDLLDNSIDGATQINSNDLSGFVINIEIDANKLYIKDNCGGFSLDRAQRYAFRFGRPEDAPTIKNSVGRFGIGMKRALFKMGKKFSVESQKDREHFLVNVNVDEWCDKVKQVNTLDGKTVEIDDWTFESTILDNLNVNDGTIIEVTDLKEDVKALFGSDDFLNSLSACITKMLCFSLIKGMKITLNNKELVADSPELFISEKTKPYFIKGEIDGVRYKIVAGLGRIGEPKLSGWYVFCNNRLVLEGDQTSLTGWGVNSISKWHIDYAMFRGFVFLYSQETSKLPLTTTKKGLDASSNIYRKILPHMRNGMIRVMSFLKAITGLKEEANDYRKLIGDISDKMNIESIRTYDSEIIGEKSFIAPELDLQKIAEKKNTVRVAYDVNKKTAEIAKDNADVSSYKELGKTTFNYYVKMEGIDYE